MVDAVMKLWSSTTPMDMKDKLEQLKVAETSKWKSITSQMQQWSPASYPTLRQSFCTFHKPDFDVNSHLCKFITNVKTYYSVSTYKFHLQYYYQHIHKHLFNGKAVLNIKALELCMELYRQAGIKKLVSDIL